MRHGVGAATLSIAIILVVACASPQKGDGLKDPGVDARGGGGPAPDGSVTSSDTAGGSADAAPGITDTALDVNPADTRGAVCTGNQTRCALGEVPEVCQGNRWVAGTACAFVCSNGACAGECKPNAKVCSGPQGLTPRTCDSMGAWSSGTPCPNLCTDGACVGSCPPGDRKCSGNTPEACNASGTWMKATACPYVCAGQGQCTGVCVPTTTRCSGTEHQTCDGGGQWVASGGDCTPPTVVAVSPANGATGVRSDAKVVITFSEPMNRSATEAAFTSADLPQVTLAWNAASTSLVVTPVGGLAYAEGTSPAVTAKAYALSIGSGATDASGNKAAPSSASFTTMRRITHTLDVILDLTGFATGAGFGLGTHGASIAVYGNGTAAGIVSFDITGIPDAGVELENAEARFYQFQAASEMFTNGGNIKLERIRFGVANGDVLYLPALAQLGAVSSSADLGWRNKQVTEALRADLATRSAGGNRSQFRLTAAGSSGSTLFSSSLDHQGGPPKLSVVFLYP